MKLKIGAFLGAVLLVLSIAVLPTRAAAGVVLDMKTEFKVGDKIEVIIRCIDANGNIVAGDVKFTYKTEQFEYISCSEDATVENGILTASGKNVTIYLKAKVAGDWYIRVDQLDANGNSLYAAGVTLKINPGSGSGDEGNAGNEGNTGNEGDTGNEGNTGDEGGSDEENNGNTGNDGNVNDETNRLQEAYILVNNFLYTVSTKHWDEMFDAGFVEGELLINNIVTSGLQYKDTGIWLVHLVNGETGKDEGYYSYNPETQKVCPYITYGVGDKELENELESLKENLQKANDKYEVVKQKNRNMLIGIIIGVALLLVVAIAILLYKRRLEDEEYEMDYMRTDGGAPLKKQGEYLNAIANNSYKEDEGLPRDSFYGSTEEKSRKVTPTRNKELNEDSVEIIDLEDL